LSQGVRDGVRVCERLPSSLLAEAHSRVSRARITKRGPNERPATRADRLDRGTPIPDVLSGAIV
jgi:hypothetical protein